MNKFLLLLIIVLSSCTSKNVVNIEFDNSFKEKMSFKEFEIKLKKYSVNNSYPNIDE